MNISKISYGVFWLCVAGLGMSMVAAEWDYSNADRLGASFLIAGMTARFIGFMMEK